MPILRWKPAPEDGVSPPPIHPLSHSSPPTGRGILRACVKTEENPPRGRGHGLCKGLEKVIPGTRLANNVQHPICIVNHNAPYPSHATSKKSVREHACSRAHHNDFSPRLLLLQKSFEGVVNQRCSCDDKEISLRDNLMGLCKGYKVFQFITFEC